MSDFRVFITGGVTLAQWVDPPATVGGRELPSRLNPQAEFGHTRQVGAVGTEITLGANVPGLGSEPLDSALVDGKLYSAQWLEFPGDHGPPGFTGAVGQSSIQRFTPLDTGHHTLIVSREGHGGIIVHIDVDS